MNNRTACLLFVLMSTPLFGMEKPTHVSLVDAIFTKQHLSNADFSDKDLSGATFTECNLFGAHFDRTNLMGARFYNCILDNATFVGATIKNTTCFPPAKETVALMILAEQAKEQ